jgi:invasion protein IalB
MTFRKAFLTIAAIASMTAFIPQAMAQTPQLIGNYGDWAAYSFTENGSKVCYMVSQPKKAEGNYTKRGDIFALVTHRPGENTKNVFSYITGYTYKGGSDVTVQVNGETYTLFTEKDMAWTPDQDSDNRLAEDIRKGSTLIVKGTSSRGTLTTDTFSLKGSGGAHDAISEACGV